MNEYNEGDLVEAVKGEQRIVGRLGGHRTGLLFVGDSARTVDSLTSQGWTLKTIEKAAPPLPTEKGWYLDGTGGPWKILHNAHGEPEWFASGEDFVGLPHIAQYAPFTRLEPEAVTARRVLEAIETVYGEDYLNNSVDSWNLVAKQFGVTS